MFPQTVVLMEELRRRARLARPNNQKLARWVDDYIDAKISEGGNVIFLTQWCLSKGLERRFPPGSPVFMQKKEIEIFRDYVAGIFAEFAKCGVGLEWWITFNKGFTETRRLDEDLAKQYKTKINELILEYCTGCQIITLDWEREILGGKPQPNQEVLRVPLRFMSTETLEREVGWAKKWQEQETAMHLSDEEISREVIFQAACEAEEGRFMLSKDFPLGECALVPLEVPEQFCFFGLFAPGFQDRIAAILPPYPWRVKG